jgi:hypothetical protein
VLRCAREKWGGRAVPALGSFYPPASRTVPGRVREKGNILSFAAVLAPSYLAKMTP